MQIYLIVVVGLNGRYRSWPIYTASVGGTTIIETTPIQQQPFPNPNGINRNWQRLMLNVAQKINVILNTADFIFQKRRKWTAGMRTNKLV